MMVIMPCSDFMQQVSITKIVQSTKLFEWVYLKEAVREDLFKRSTLKSCVISCFKRQAIAFILFGTCNL